MIFIRKSRRQVQLKKRAAFGVSRTSQVGGLRPLGDGLMSYYGYYGYLVGIYLDSQKWRSEDITWLLMVDWLC